MINSERKKKIVDLCVTATFDDGVVEELKTEKKEEEKGVIWFSFEEKQKKWITTMISKFLFLFAVFWF